MAGTDALDGLIRRARRRHLQNLLLKESVRSLSVIMTGLIVLLILGTEILDWRWLGGLVALGIAAGFRTLPREMPSRYRTAQLIDRRLDLHDSLSTALFYNRIEANRPAAESMRRAQLQEAEEIACRVDVTRAVPFAFPRSLYAMAALCLLASSLFALRYGFTRHLDLKPPLSTIVFDAFHFFSEPQAEHNKKREIRHADDKLSQFGLSTEEETARNDGSSGTAPGLSTKAPDSDTTRRDAAGSSKQQASATNEAVNRRKDGGDQGEGSSQASEQSSAADRDSANQSAKNGSPTSGRAANNQQSASSQRESNGLLDKFRDAVDNLLSRLRSQPKPSGSQQASNAPDRQDSRQSRRDQGQKGSERANRKSDNSANGEAEGDDQGQGSEKAQSGPGKQGGHDGEQASKQGQSGVGKDDGSKDIHEAEQLAAMGKISEIIGKRSQNLTGEVMVEVNSGKQDLRTAYSQQSASHADTGGEIHRDEIPLAYQRYVQQYFEELRKTPPAAAPKQK